MQVKVGRHHEKCWGIIFKHLMTRAVHLDLLRSMDADTYLIALRRFIARRGTPAELWSDQGTDFKGGEWELQEAFANMALALQQQLVNQLAKELRSSLPSSPSLWQCMGTGNMFRQDCVWELNRCMRKCFTQCSWKSRPSSTQNHYASAVIADINPVTLNSLFMGLDPWIHAHGAGGWITSIGLFLGHPIAKWLGHVLMGLCTPNDRAPV